MITLNEYLINKKNKHLVNKIVYNYHPKTKEELHSLVNKLIKERGLNADLNDIDTSKIKDMSFLFAIGSGTSNSFNGDISKWNVSNVENMSYMFAQSDFNGDISEWDVSNVKYMKMMFANSNFKRDISDWNASSTKNVENMFRDCKIPDNYKPSVLEFFIPI